LALTTETLPTSERLTANPDFLRLWLGQVASSLGNGVSLIATPLLVLALTNSPAQAGIVAAARTAPYLILGLPAGALIDRWDRRTVLICCDLARALAMGSVPVAWSLGLLSLLQLVAVALVQGAAVSFANIAQTASLPRLVRKEQIAAAQALNVSSQGIASLVGPGVGGLVVALGRTTVEGAAIAFAVDAATYLVSMSMLATIRRPFQSARLAAARSLRAEIVEGLRYLWADRPIRLLAVVNCVHRLCVGTVVVLPVVVFARDALRADPAVIGLIVGAAGAGGLIGSAMTPPLRRRLPVGWHMVGVIALHALGIATVALAASVAVAMAGMLLVGTAEAMTGIVQVSYRLVTIPDALQGRVNSVYRLGSFAAMTAGTTLAGLLAEGFGPRVALACMAAWVLTVALGTAASGVRRL
jgi:MFS family permease